MSFSITETETLYHEVMRAILDNPKERWPVITEKLSITKEQMFDALNFIDNEGYLANIKFARGGHGNKIMVPFYDNATITQRGIDFMKQMEKSVTSTVAEAATSISLPSVFISYNWSNSDFVDTIETALNGKVFVKRDKNEIKTWGSITEFMKTIRQQDFAVLVISDAYLKSTACLFEVVQLMKDDGWNIRTMYVVIKDANRIYKAPGQLPYIEHWCDYCTELSEAIKKLPPATTAKQSEELNKAETIRNSMSEFLAIVADANNPQEDSAIEAIVSRVEKVGELATATVVFSAKTPTSINLRKESAELLLTACEGDGVIIATQSLSSFSVTVAGKNIVDCATNRDIALWQSVLKELENRNYIKATNYKKEIYRVTQEGYDLAEDISTPDIPKQP